MATMDEIIARVRLEIDDTPQPFMTVIRGDGSRTDFELDSKDIIDTSVDVYIQNTDDTRTPVDPSSYVLDLASGNIYFNTPPAPDSMVVFKGSSYGLFSDTELTQFVNDAITQHTADKIVQTRYRDSHGFIQYDKRPMTLDLLPPGQDHLVALWAAIQALWALSTSASFDINVSVPEGTSIPRGQRFQQIIAQIDNLENRYKEVSLMMGVGLFAPEVFKQRRVSRQTGRLIPVWVDREYDDYGRPIRVVPPVTERDADPDGPASPWYPSGYGY